MHVGLSAPIATLLSPALVFFFFWLVFNFKLIHCIDDNTCTRFNKCNRRLAVLHLDFHRRLH